MTTPDMTPSQMQKLSGTRQQPPHRPFPPQQRTAVETLVRTAESRRKRQPGQQQQEREQYPLSRAPYLGAAAREL
ncbi:hypothetical protein E2C01_072875 [Portunus trituberculatus]|uniref:Uncharacterized protein n=1 Tax=Portunus trituberculatus TaxID=210409 RepID=A0A5B7I188_PORTR|nr:hypothetical protein [Portunus trituberculatus]